MEPSSSSSGKEEETERPGTSVARRTREEITSTYRAMYGGPEGTPASAWRSLANKTDDGLSRMLEEHARVTDIDDDGKKNDDGASSSLHKALKDISVLTTGQVLQHRHAMESLVDILHSHDDSEEMMREIHTQGATHVLYANISSSDKTMAKLSADGLVCICTHEKEALKEVVSSREISSVILGTCVRNILTGSHSTTYGDLFDLLLGSKSRIISQCCAEHKVVLKCIERLQTHVEKHDKVDTNALHMLSCMVATGLEYYMDSIFWNGGLDVFVIILSTPMVQNDESIRESVVRMMSALCHHNPDAAGFLCTPKAIEYLSRMIADPDISIDIQVDVAWILLEISRVENKKTETIESLQDYCLPRVCEVIHQSKQQVIDTTAECDLWTRCAGIVSYLCRDSHVCCHVVIFHADILQQTIRLLTQSFKYEQTSVLLTSAQTFAINTTSTTTTTTTTTRM